MCFILTLNSYKRENTVKTLKISHDDWNLTNGITKCAMNPNKQNSNNIKKNLSDNNMFFNNTFA